MEIISIQAQINEIDVGDGCWWNILRNAEIILQIM